MRIRNADSGILNEVSDLRFENVIVLTRPKGLSDWIRRSIRIIVGSILLIAGLAKLFSPASTSLAVSLYLPIEPEWCLRVLIWALSISEVLIGYLLLHGSAIGISGIAPYGALLFSSIFLGVGIGRLILGAGESCGCFGELDFLSSPTSGVLRDTALVFGSLLLVINEKGQNLKKLAIASIIPLIAVGNVCLTVSNGLHYELQGLGHISIPNRNDWYGLPVDAIGNSTVEDLIFDLLGDSYQVGERLLDTPAYPVYFDGYENRMHNGWVVMMAVPIKIPNIVIYRIFAYYDKDIYLKYLDIDTSLITNRNIISDPNIFNDLINRLLSLSWRHFYIYGYDGIIFPQAEEVIINILGAINNMTNQLMCIEYKLQ